MQDSPHNGPVCHRGCPNDPDTSAATYLGGGGGGLPESVTESLSPSFCAMPSSGKGGAFGRPEADRQEAQLSPSFVQPAVKTHAGTVG